MKPIKMTRLPTPEKLPAPNEEPTEGARRATGVGSSLGEKENLTFPDPEVPEKKVRRNFTAAYKLRILQEADSCDQLGQIGRLLRQESLYSSNLTAWRRSRDKGQLQGMSPQKRGRKHKERNPLSAEVAQLQKEKRQLENRLRKADLIIDAQKKISQILGIIQNIDENSGGV